MTQIKYMTDKELLREMTHNPMVIFSLPLDHFVAE